MGEAAEMSAFDEVNVFFDRAADRLGLALRPILALPVLVVSDQFLLLGVDGDCRIVRGDAFRGLRIDVRKLRIPVGVLRPFEGLAVPL